MADVQLQKTQNAALSDYRSFGGSQVPAGRFPKVSIGITVDKCSKTGPGLKTEGAASLPTGGETFSWQRTDGATRPGIVETSDKNRPNAFEINKGSAWFSTRSERCKRVETPETVKFFASSASMLQSENGMHKKVDSIAYVKRREKHGNVETVEEAAFAMQETQQGNTMNTREKPEDTAVFNRKRVSTMGHEMKRENGGGVERIEDTAFLTKQLGGEENNKEPEQMAKCSNEDLKMKLWEILGTAPTENKNTAKSPIIANHKESLNTQRSRAIQNDEVARTKLNLPELDNNKENKENKNTAQRNTVRSTGCKKGKTAKGKLTSSVLEENKENLDVNQSKEFQKAKATKCKQNSDTIETDSESPNQVMRRPVTRSLARKKAPPKKMQKLQDNTTCAKKPLSSSSSDVKHTSEKNVFAFDEVEDKTGSSSHTSNSHPNRSGEKINDPEKARIEPKKPHFLDKHLDNSDREQTSPSPNKPSQQSKEKGNSSVPAQGKKRLLQTGDGNPNDNISPQKAAQLNIGSPMWAYKREIRENTDSPLLKMKEHSWGHEDSPSELKGGFLHADIASRSMGRKDGQPGVFHSPPTLAAASFPPSPGVEHDEAMSSPVAVWGSKSMQKNHSSKTLGKSTPGSSEAEEADTESSDDTRDPHHPGDMESPLLKVREHEKRKFFLSPMEEQLTESEADVAASQDGSLKKSLISLRHTKRFRSSVNTKPTKPKIPLPSPIGTSRTQETVRSLATLEQYPEGSLARCLGQLALVLERFKRRVKSQTGKRSSEILSAAADKIRQHLQGVESQMLVDVEKFNSIGKSKRKHLESRFQGQQERLKLLHDKFKEEVNQHLSDCRTTVEELEACNMELKGAADRQKASHRKLLQQAEKAMEGEIIDAETSIAAIHKDARKKMIGLKRVLEEWMD